MLKVLALLSLGSLLLIACHPATAPEPAPKGCGPLQSIDTTVVIGGGYTGLLQTTPSAGANCPARYQFSYRYVDPSVPNDRPPFDISMAFRTPHSHFSHPPDPELSNGWWYVDFVDSSASFYTTTNYEVVIDDYFGLAVEIHSRIEYH